MFPELAPIIDDSCSGSACHNTPNGGGGSFARVYLETAGDVEIAIWTADLIERVRSGSMPSGGRDLVGTTREAFVSMLERWQADGFPE